MHDPADVAIRILEIDEVAHARDGHLGDDDLAPGLRDLLGVLVNRRDLNCVRHRLLRVPAPGGGVLVPSTAPVDVISFAERRVIGAH